MKEYQVVVTETLERTITVEARNAAEAKEIVEQQWRNSDHVLDSDDYAGVKFTVPKTRDRER